MPKPSLSTLLKSVRQSEKSTSHNHVGTYVHSEAILTTTAMLFSSITCKYNKDVENVFKPGAKGVQLDSEADSKDDQVADAAQAGLGITVAKFKEGINF